MQSLQRSRGELRLKSPKTDTSRRRVVLPGFCIDALIRHRTSEREKLASLGLPIDQATLAFTSQAGTAIEPRNVNRAFEALLKKAKLRRVKLHDLRHTCASLLLAEGVAPRVVMELLGHSAIAVTMNTYSHVIPALQDESAKRMDALFGAENTKLRETEKTETLKYEYIVHLAFLSASTYVFTD